MPQGLLQKFAATTAGAIAGFALLGAISPQSSQAASFTYQTDFSLTANSGPVPTLFPTIATGSAQFTKTDSVTLPGLFDYQVESFQLSLVPLSTTVTLDTLRQSQNAAVLSGLNAAVFAQVPPEFKKYSQILPSVLAGTSPNYIGDGDFPPLGTFSYSFSNQDVVMGRNLAATQVATLNLPPTDVAQISLLLGALPSLFPNGGTASIQFSQVATSVLPTAPSVSPVVLPEVLAVGGGESSAAVPEPTTMAGMALAGGAMAAARRRQKQKNAA